MILTIDTDEKKPTVVIEGPVTFDELYDALESLFGEERMFEVTIKPKPTRTEFVPYQNPINYFDHLVDKFSQPEPYRVYCGTGTTAVGVHNKNYNTTATQLDPKTPFTYTNNGKKNNN